MNQIQMKYAIAKAAYEAAFEDQNWELVDQLEDPMLDAEFELFEWMSEKVIAAGMKKEDVDFLRRNAGNDRWDQMIDMAMRLNA